MKIVSVVGARPQFIKLAPLVRVFKRRSLRHLIVHTGQHYDYKMSRVFFNQLGMPEPDYHLGVGSGTHGFQTAEMLKGIERVLLDVKPRWVVVYGDTNSTLAGALAAVKYHMPVVHVEAGLRSYNRRMPEEVNRVLTDHVSFLLFCPTETAVENLKREGFDNILLDGKLAGLDIALPDYDGRRPLVSNTGDIMYDALSLCLEVAQKNSRILDNQGLSDKNYYLATVHRAENTDNPENLKAIFEALAEVSRDTPVVVPLHPRTKGALSALNISTPDLMLIEPVSYFDMLILERNASRVFTDSGGVQKEAFLLGVPCVTLRNETEWIETVESGWNILAGARREAIVEAALTALGEHATPHYYGCGNAAEIMTEILFSLK